MVEGFPSFGTEAFVMVANYADLHRFAFLSWWSHDFIRVSPNSSVTDVTKTPHS